MAAGRAWLEENLGGSAQQRRAVDGVRGEAGEVMAPTPRALAHERIEFDGGAPETIERTAANWPQAPPTLSHYTPVPWPDGLGPKPASQAPPGDSLPQADILIVTWTVEEGSSLAHVLTPGYESILPTKSHPAKPGIVYWKPYTKNYERIATQMNPGCPAREKERLGSYWSAEIAGKSVTLFKSESHFSQDGPEELTTTPNLLVWKQIIEDCKPKLVITTGTGGGIGSGAEVGDVIVSRFVTFDSGGKPPEFKPFECPGDVPADYLHTALSLFAANAANLPKSNSRGPRIVNSKSARSGIVTTKGFQYDDTANTFGLQGKGDVCEMGDAVLAYVCAELGPNAPAYAMVRNVSDPQIDSSDPEAAKLANWIYENFGRWSSVCSAIACWGIVVGLDTGR